MLIWAKLEELLIFKVIAALHETSTKMYNFIGIWAKLEELLNFKVTATLRYVKQQQKNKTTDG